MATTPEKSPRRRGRPSKEEEVRQALAEIGIDPALVDVRRILAAIAVNKSMPPRARVAACKALLAARDHPGPEAGLPPSLATRCRCGRRSCWRRAEGQTDTMDEDDQIPVVAMHRGVGIEHQQPPERVELVKREIDRVHRMSGTDELAEYAGDAGAPAGGPNACRRAGGSLVGDCRRGAAASANQPGALARRDGRAWLPALARPGPLCLLVRRTGRY